MAELYEEFQALNEKIKIYDKKLKIIFKDNPVHQRLAEVEGLGVMTTTALLAAVGDPKVFKNGRQMSSWIGLVPRQYSSGNKRVLLGISKRGDCYLRKLLIHGARSVVYRAINKQDKRSIWINQLVERRGINKTSVAIANKNIRIAWAMLMNETTYIH